MSDSSKGHSRSAVREYILKILCYLIILLAITILTAFIAIKPVTGLVHKVEAYVSAEDRDIVLNDNSYTPLSIESTDGLKINLGDKIASISSDDFNLNCSVYYGSNRISFGEGAGFYVKSDLFGQGGTSFVTGSAEKYFSALTFAAVDDVITVVTNYGEYNYRVKDIEYVDSNKNSDYSTDRETLVLCALTSDFSEHSGKTLYVYAERIGEAE